MGRVYSERLKRENRSIPASKKVSKVFNNNDLSLDQVYRGIAPFVRQRLFRGARMPGGWLAQEEDRAGQGWRKRMRGNVVDVIYVSHYLQQMAVEVEVTDEFKAWFLDLTLSQREAITRVVDMLERFGIDLPFPYSSSISGSKIALRELRMQHMGEPYRVLYVFDPARQAVLLVGGNKIGKGNRWYKSAIRLAERLYDEYLRGV